MKKFIIMIMTLILSFACVACSNEPKEPQHILTFKEGKMVTMDETEYVGIFFEYTNNSDETAVICDEINVKAFQNGVELNIVVHTGQETEGAIQCDTSVQADTTTDVVWLFEKQDDSPVSVECTDGQMDRNLSLN